MSRFRMTDILFELIDLSQDRMDEVRCQLNYYRASVYKHETASLIKTKLSLLQGVSTLVGDEHLNEAFSDYEATALHGAEDLIPGECSFSKRVASLLHALDANLSRLYKAAVSRTLTADEETLTAAVKERRREVLALCTEGSRQWTFFESL